MEVGASRVSGVWRGSPILPGLSHGCVRFIVLIEAEFTRTGYSYGCCGRRAVVNAVKGAEYFPYKGRSPIDSPLVVEDSIALEGGLDDWEIRVIDDVYLL